MFSRTPSTVEHRAVVDGGEFAGRRLGLDLDDVGTGVIDLDRDLDFLADAHAPRRRRLALTGDGQLDGPGVARRRFGDLDLDRLFAAHQAEARGAQHFEPAVELSRLAGDERVNGRVEAERRGAAGHVMDVAVGEHDHAREPVRRHVGQRLAEVGEQHGAVALAVAGDG